MKDFYDSFKGNRVRLIFGSLLKTVEAFFELLIPLYIANIINKGIVFSDLDVLYKSIFIMIIFYILGYICSVVSQYFSSLVASNVGRNIRDKVFSKVINFKQSDMDQFDSKFINNSVTNDVKQLENGINMIMRIGLRAPIVAIGSIIMAITINFKLSIIFIISTLIIFLFLYFFLAYLSKCYLKIQRYKDGLNSVVSEHVDGSRVIRAFNEQEKEIDRGIRANSKIFKMSLFVEYLQSLFNPITYLIINISLLIILYISNGYVGKNLLFDGDVVALINYLTQTFVAISALVNLVFIFSKSLASFYRIRDLFNYESVVLEREDVVIDKISSLEFCDVDFSYRNNKKVLSGVSFEIGSGTTLGIIGLTGSGKSTLSKLILNLYKCSNGNILINDININSISLESLKSNIGFVMQKPNLFSGTIRDNFKVSGASEKEIDKCLKISEAYDFVYSFPKGLDTMLLENGKNLSGGQKQRLAIAIALAKKPSLLILDDSSCALDLKTEYDLYSNLKKVESCDMKIIISQRVSAMKMCDKILVIDKGKVIGFGTYKSLFKKNKVFREIVLSQEEVEDND